MNKVPLPNYWRYFSTSMSGNLHDARYYLDKVLAKEFPEHEIVALDSDGRHTSIVWRCREYLVPPGKALP